jgi:hypothetical protein
VRARVASNGRHDELAHGRVHHRADRRGDERGVAARQAEEARQHLARLLGREDLRELDDGGEAQVAAPEGGLDLGVLLDELGRGLPVLGGSCRQLQLAAEEREEAGIPQRLPQPPAVEVSEGDDEVGHRGVLTAEEVGEAGGEFACSVHARIVSSDFDGSPNVRSRLLPRDLEPASRTPLASAQRAPPRSRRPQKARAA